jgi:hypothetical protein
MEDLVKEMGRSQVEMTRKAHSEIQRDLMKTPSGIGISVEFDEECWTIQS